MRQIMTTALLWTCGSVLLALGAGGGPLLANEPELNGSFVAQQAGDGQERLQAAPAPIVTPQTRVPPVAAAEMVPPAAPPEAVWAQDAKHHTPGHYYPSYGYGGGGDSYFDYTGVRYPNTWGGLWGYGAEDRVGAARLEYLMWFSRGRSTPPLVATIGTGGPNVIYGEEPIGEDMRSGGRITLSRLLADHCTWVEARFWGVEDSTERFFGQSNGNPIAGRPFFNTALGVEDVQLIAFPTLFTGGSINVLSKNDMLSFEAWFRRTWCEDSCTRIDVLAGYQFARIDDSLWINSTTTSIVSPPISVPVNTVISVTDRFNTENEFHGGQVGFLWEGRKDSWSLEVLGKFGLGAMRQSVAISGSTVTDPPGAPATESPNGLFARASNDGVHQRYQLAYIPELNANLCYNFSPAWKIWIGYSFIYFSDVVLAGNQIDRGVNFLPTGPPRPLFRFDDSDFLIQGLNLGAEYRW